MPVSRGYALALSAALHSAGLGVAGWATYGQLREPSAPVALRTTRAYALTFLTVAPPKPQPITTPPRARPRTPPPTAPATVASGSSTTEQPRPSAAALATTGTGPAGSPLRAQELAPGVTAAAIPVMAPPPESVPESHMPPRGAYRAATLVTAAGSACPDLPVPREWGRREISVAVAFVVDTAGKVDPSTLRIIESPGRPPAGRGFYPRIYVVGTKAGASPGRMDSARYDSAVTHAVTSHIARLRFRPALVGGRPVRSTVLVACHRPPSS
jgi:hypothetical protein